MKKSLLILSILASFFLAGQDIGVTQITSPVTGCNLSATESVVVKIFNYGSNMSGVPFTVSYTINGGAPVSEAVTLPSFLTNSTITYTVTTPANLSAAGTYTITASATVAGDVNMTNDAVTGYTVTNSAPSVGGDLSGGTNVCISGNSGLLSLSGQTGSIQNWEYSTDGGTTWFTLSNTTTSQPYSNIAVPTKYRVKVQNPGCAVAYSDTADMTIDPVTVGGTLAGSATRCISGNSGTVSLSGHTGTVQNWEFSINGGASWSPIANTTTSQNYTNLTVSTRYRVVVKSGACSSQNSSQAIITVSPLSVGGTIAGDDTVCSGTNSGSLVLSGHTGTISWQQSTDGGVTFANTTPPNTTTTYNYSNVSTTTLYRARLTSGACPTVNSDTAGILVTAATVGGTVAGSSAVCSGANTDTLALSGQTGNVLDWESSTDGGTTWIPIGNTNDSLVFSNVAANTLFHAVVQNPGCAVVSSSAATVTVNNPSVGGTVTGNATVCASGNSGTILLSSYTGTIQDWLSSTDGGATWTSTGNTTASQSFSNLSDTTVYVAVVVNGVCPADSSDTATVVVDPVTVGGTVNSNATVCFGNNADTLDLTGNTGGVLNWEFSTDGGVTWVQLANTTTSQPFSNITANTQYRAVVKNGTCATEYSTTATIMVSPQAVGGTVYGGTTVCAGSNSGTLTLVGYASSVVQWEASTDNGTTWTPIANTTAFENFSNLAQTTWFQAIVGSGVCPNDTSSVTVVNVDTASVGGTVSMSDTVCAGQNGDTLTLAGNNGTVTGWQMSTDGGATWLSLANATSSQPYANLNATTMFRTEVKNGVCPPATSAAATISVDQASNGGTVSSSATVCEVYNGGTLSLGSVSGTVLDWQISTDGGATWTSLSNTGTTQTYSGLTDTTWYRGIAQNGVCPADTGAAAVITVIPKPNAQFSAPDTCFGIPTAFTNSTTVQAGYVQMYNWDFGDNTSSVSGSPVHTYADTGTFNVTLVALSNFGCLDTTIIPVKVIGLPSVMFTYSGPLQFCAGDSVTISIPAGTNMYLWSTGDTVPSITVDTTGIWTVTVTDSASGCMNTDSVTTTVYSSPVVNAGPDDTVSVGNTLTLSGSGAGTVIWTPSSSLDDPTSLTPVAMPAITTTYTLTVTSANGCSAQDSVRIVVVQGYEFEIYTVITPNGDGFNDTWNIKNISYYPNNEVIIFNRHGQKVFSMTGYDNSWDGTFGATPVPDGTYYYVLKFSDSEESFTGAITVLRGSK